VAYDAGFNQHPTSNIRFALPYADGHVALAIDSADSNHDGDRTCPHARGNPGVHLHDARNDARRLASEGDVRSGNRDPLLTSVARAYGTPLQKTTSFTSDFWTGLVTSATDPNGVVTYTGYDVLGRPFLVQEAANTPQARYTAMGFSLQNRCALIQRDQNTSGDYALKFLEHYDRLGRVWLRQRIENGVTPLFTDTSSGIRTETRYHNSSLGRFQLASNPHKFSSYTTDPDMGWTLTAVDNVGRPSKVSHYAGPNAPVWNDSSPTSGYTALTYNGTATGSNHIVTAVSDQRTLKWTFTDGLGRLSAVREDPFSSNLTTTYAYDALDNLTNVTQSGAQPRTFGYDTLGRLTAATNPESGGTSYTYDNNGNLTRRIAAGGVTTNYAYDSLNRLTLKSYSSSNTPNVTYCYDGYVAGSTDGQCTSGFVPYSAGRVTQVKSSASTNSYLSYDGLGRVTASSQLTGGPPAYSFTYSYNLVDGLTSTTYPSGRAVSFAYDSAGRVNRIINGQLTSSNNYAAFMAYSSHGALTGMQLGNGRWETNVFNDRLQVADMKLGTNPSTSDQWLLHNDYGGSLNNGNVMSQNISAPGMTTINQVYGYDGANRLSFAAENPNTAATACSQISSQWCRQFGYDARGNRSIIANPGQGSSSSVPTTFDSFNRIADTGWSYAEAVIGSGRGNVTKQPSGETFAYDAENRQVASCTADPDPANCTNVAAAGRTLYTYDGDGKRVKTQGADGTQTIFVYEVMGNVAAEYSNQTAAAPPCTTCYLTTDHLGSTRVMTNQIGIVVMRQDYLPFGEAITVSGANPRQSVQGYGVAPSVRQQFTSKERDTETGLDYFGARYFSGAQGRFTAPDEPFVDQWEQDPQSWNLYTYGRNNPLRFVDPTGQGCTVSGSSYADNSEPGPDCKTVLAGNGEAQQVTVNAKGGNTLGAFAINAGFALSNVANDYFAWMFQQRPDVLQNTPTSRAFVGQAAAATVVVGTALIGPGGGVAQAPREIKVTWKGLLHVIQRHSGGMAGKSFFGDSAAVTGLVKAAEAVAPAAQAGGNFVRIVDAGRTIGTDVTTGQATSIYTVITNKAGELVTAFPGRPTR
jgi:RHS repeat-associated protein